MPKMKTHRGAAKRLKRSGSGKLRRFKTNKSHLLTHKARDRKRRLKGSTDVHSASIKKAEKLVPYI